MSPFTSVLTALGVDHIQLAYEYADSGDVDGYGSLLAIDVEIDAPGFLHGRGRTQVLHRAAQLGPRQTRHRIQDIVADRHRVAVLGTVRIRRPATALEFIDVFNLSCDALILRQHRYLRVKDNSTSIHGEE